ncbi:MAG: DUF1573 domain-containing protein [Kiritimatiellae bacterium]|nr:DUF1573 domain-containing protein [Kiritimatiellia bacterium]
MSGRVLPFLVILPRLALAAAGPLTCSPETVDAGTFSAATERRVTVTVRNAGSDPVEIFNAVSTCDCVKIDRYPQTIPPHGEGVIHARLPAYSLASHSGPFVRHIQLTTSAEGTDAQRQIPITGTVQAAYTVTCDAENLILNPEPGERWNGTFVIATRLPGFAFQDLRTRDERVTASTHALSVTTNTAGEVSFKVTRSVTFSAEPTQSSVLFVTLAAPIPYPSPPPIPLVVEAIRNPSLRLVPASLTIPYSLTPVRRQITVLPTLKPGETVTDDIALVNGMEDATVTFTPLPARNGFRMAVELTPQAVETIHREGKRILRVRCNGQTAEAAVCPTRDPAKGPQRKEGHP